VIVLGKVVFRSAVDRELRWETWVGSSGNLSGKLEGNNRQA